MMDQWAVLEKPLLDLAAQAATYLPRAFGAVLLLILGWAAARLVRNVTGKLLRFLRFDALAERAGIEDFLLQGGVRFTAVTLTANILYWLVIMAVVLASLNLLGMGIAAELFNRIVLYIPKVIVAVIIFMFGLVFARFMREVVVAYLNNVGVHGARAIGTLAQYAIVIFVVSIALEQLAIGGQVLVSAFQMAFGAVCLAMALAFGLGGRRWAGKVLEKLWD